MSSAASPIGLCARLAPVQLGPDLQRLREYGCAAVEWERSALSRLDEAGLRSLRQTIEVAGLSTAVVYADGEVDLGALRPAFDQAALLDAKYVVTGAPAGDVAPPTGWLAAVLDLAEATRRPVLVENRPDTWADSGRRLGQLLEGRESPWLGAAFDPAGFAALREHPFLSAFMPGHLKSRVRLLRVADAAFGDRAPARLGEGSAEVAELVSALLARGFSGCFSVAADDMASTEQALDDFARLLAHLGFAGCA